ncbi:MAG TPA: hypothetical protein VJX23_07390 [Candidatus Binataceae bacterium]|nr:hypothetical protein [Candidatus Binataceae bacterium]
MQAVFQKMAQDLVERVIPAISPSYHQGTVGMIAAMLAMVSEEWDRAASRRAEENDRLRELFRDAAPVVENADLKRRLLELAKTQDRDLRVSALEANNCALRVALIDLHSKIERQKGPAARKVEDAIWKELVRSTERRRFSTAPF